MDAAAPFLAKFLPNIRGSSLIPSTWSEFGKWGNWTFDAIFYNISRVPADLWSECTSKHVPEGSIVVLTRIADATATNGRTFILSHYEKATDVKDLDTLTCIAIAGVGSSALGTVALAVDVADAIGGNVTVAGIVTGEGRGDVREEGTDGWFVMRPGNLGRQWFDNMLGFMKLSLNRTLGIPMRITEQMTGDIEAFSKNFLPKSLSDIDAKSTESNETVYLLENAKNLKLVVAHSKGGLYLAKALCMLVEDKTKADLIEVLGKRLTIVTLGAVIYAPAQLSGCMHQFLGELDSFGMMNSRLSVEKTIVPGVMHHMNTALPLHMNCSKVLQSHFPELINSQLAKKNPVVANASVD